MIESAGYHHGRRDAIPYLVDLANREIASLGYGSPLVLLRDDVLVDPIQVRNGTMEVRHGPGLGVELDDAKLKKYAHKVTVEHEKPVTVPIDRPRPWQTGI